ncbi:MAG: SDR family oxidoreductase [Chloroflexi bacterium]|nr:SDR family oxidoreductase [Chloroflexota bacterium]MBI4198192.1 SDR family oxidoreductase [Chloroflexota bacterium]
MDLGLTGKTALVVGGSRGLGKAIALELAREGADIAISARGLDALKQTAQELHQLTGCRIVPLPVDVTSKEQVDGMVAQAADALGGLHILVNSAATPGGSASGPVDGIPDAAVLSDFDIKYMGALRTSRAAAPYLRRMKWGRIINLSGHNARNAVNISAGARNVALVHLTRTLASQLGKDGITVNCIHPGPTRTERFAQRAAQEGLTLKEYERRGLQNALWSNFIGRVVDASEIAFLAVFLCSEKAGAITGEVIEASGGVGAAVHY